MRLGTYFPNGAVETIRTGEETDIKRAIVSRFCQIFLIFSVILLSASELKAHHAKVGNWYFQKHPGLKHFNVTLPFRANPKQNFTRQEVTGLRMTKCEAAKFPHIAHNSERVLHMEKRAVRIDVSKSLNLGESEVNGLGLLGLNYAWRYCPARQQFGKPMYEAIQVDVYRNGQHIYHFYPAKTDLFRKTVTMNRLWSVWDAEAQKKREREAAAQQERQRQQRLAAKRKADAESAAFWRKFWFFAFLIGAGWVWFKYRGPILAFYYHNFTKHPAEDLVNSTIRTGKKLDGQRLADELDKAAKASNPIEAQVRAEQAKDIAAKARKKTAEIKAQEELADAMIDVERAKRAEKRAREAWEKARKNKE